MNSQCLLDLTPEEFQIVDAILQKFVPGRPIFIFGSRATGRARRRSDLDLAIGGDEPLGLSLRANLRGAFSGSDLPMMVDFVELRDTTGIFRKRIEGEWIPFQAAADQMALKVAA